MANKIEEIYPVFLEHPLVSTDSRQVAPGSIFFALKGKSFNGNEFAGRALEAGAVLAIVDNERYAVNESCIVVEDVLESLQALARHHRLQFNIPVIAITGTNGKTTTKELISAVLAMKFNTLATAGNLNNHIGVPLTLLNITKSTEIAIIEMGANHPGEIDFLCNLACPGFGIITNIGKAHLEGFGSYEGVIATKTELYRFLEVRHGEIFINNEDPVLMQHAEGLKKVTYGTSPADAAILTLSANPYVNLLIRLGSGEELNIESKLYGLYNTPNIVAAACIGAFFKVPLPEIKTALEAYQPGNNRSQIKQTKDNLLILDAYNANPSSMKAAIETFADSAYASKMVILGDMLELGEVSDQEHLDILTLLERMPIGHVYLVGPIFTRLNTKRENICFQDSNLAKMWFEHHKTEQSTILIKGSRGIRLERLVEVL